MNEKTTLRMPFAGIVTFLGGCIIRTPDEIEADQIAVLGVPFDAATTNRPGARYGPRSIREASLLYTYHAAKITATDLGPFPLAGLYDIEEGKTFLQGYRLVDWGDVPIVPADMETSFQRMTEAAEVLFRRARLPMFLGGDHSITFPILRGYPGPEPLHIVHFDTHLDLLDELDGARFTHGSPIRHLLGLPYFGGLTQIGIRGILNDEVFHREIRELGHEVITTYEILFRGHEVVRDRLPQNKNIYITLDIDVFDPSVAPGTGTPEPGGLRYWDVRFLLKFLLEHNRLMGFDIVEVSPLYDANGITSQLAARVAIDMLGYALGNKDKDSSTDRNLPRVSLHP